MRQLALRAALTALAVPVPVAPAQAYEERPMRLPATGPGVIAAASQPPSWLVAAQAGGAARAAVLARRFGARKLRSGAVYRVATARARAFAAALREAGALRYAEPNVSMTRQSALDVAPGGYARGYVVDAGLSPPAPTLRCQDKRSCPNRWAPRSTTATSRPPPSSPVALATAEASGLG
jgi:hypothetical protein